MGKGARSCSSTLCEGQAGHGQDFPRELKSLDGCGDPGCSAQALCEEKTLPQCVTYLPLMAPWKISTDFSEATNELALG